MLYVFWVKFRKRRTSDFFESMCTRKIFQIKVAHLIEMHILCPIDSRHKDNSFREKPFNVQNFI